MLPRSTQVRTQRDVYRGKAGGRTQEIQRLIGRSLRAVADLPALGERTILIDCDVIEADGSTRVTSITGAFVALAGALGHLREVGSIKRQVLKDHVAAASVGIVNGVSVLDLDYDEDSVAGVDMNIVMTGGGTLVEVQGTADGRPFSSVELSEMVELARAASGASSARSGAPSRSSDFLEPEALAGNWGSRRRDVIERRSPSDPLPPLS